MQPDPCVRHLSVLGVMGYPMAGYLAKAGHRRTVYNRTAPRQKNGVPSTAARGHDAAQAATGADIVFCCVGNDDDVRDVILGEDGRPHRRQ